MFGKNGRAVELMNRFAFVDIQTHDNNNAQFDAVLVTNGVGDQNDNGILTRKIEYTERGKYSELTPLIYFKNWGKNFSIEVVYADRTHSGETGVS
jgi:hypothetical protein